MVPRGGAGLMRCIARVRAEPSDEVALEVLDRTEHTQKSSTMPLCLPELRDVPEAQAKFSEIQPVAPVNLKAAALSPERISTTQPPRLSPAPTPPS
ncbi:hypothetical protein MPLDJ20_260095 [Mesorhizobium plurifarium]|jgi:hypothetical protein|uniref:Uncharacterized protein n=1 Tax=Mesorhizobium plurifarium TaxID=69974 RepID=A0A090FDN6_MESPL|nr:hypothetical protein MPLDJ20_260095 [Mesorhizobium plurifarium]